MAEAVFAFPRLACRTISFLGAGIKNVPPPCQQFDQRSISYENPTARIYSGSCLAIAEQLPTLGCESRESPDERRESPAVQQWEGYR
jgi:hypothetical protein